MIARMGRRRADQGRVAGAATRLLRHVLNCRQPFSSWSDGRVAGGPYGFSC